MDLSPLPIQKFFDNNGRPLVGGLLFTYVAGTTTKSPTYTDSIGTLNTNPVILNYRGEARVWINPLLTYKFVLAPATDTDPPSNPIWSVDQLASGLTYTDLVTILTQQFLGQIIYPRTAAEIAAAITPTLYIYPEGDIRRYGATTGALDNHVAFNSALAVSAAGGAAAHIPGGTWTITTTITVAALSSLYGEGNASVISVNGCDGLTFAADPGILPFTRFFQNFQILGVGITCQNFRAVYINFTVGSVVSGCTFTNIGIRNFGGAYYIQGLEDSNFIGCQSYNTYYGFFFFQQSVTQTLTGCIIQRGTIGAPSWGLGTGSLGVVITGGPEQENLHLTNCSIFAYDHLVDIALCFELQINACDLSNAILVGLALGSALGPLVVRDNWIQTTNAAAATIGINIPNNSPSINNKVVIEGNYIRTDFPFAGSIGISIGNGNPGTVVKSNQVIQYDKGIVLGASIGMCVKHNTINITQGNTAYSATSVALSMNSLSVDNEIGPNYVVGGLTQAATMTNASANIGVPSSSLFPVNTPVQFDTSVNGFFTGVTYYVLTSAANVITVAALVGGAAIVATGNTALNVFQAPLPVTWGAATPAGLQLYARGSFIGTLTGFGTAPTGVVDWVANGASVSVNGRFTSNLTGVSNTNAMTMTGVPFFLWPITTQQFLAAVEDNGTFVYGSATLTNIGALSFHKDPNGGLFTAAGNKGVNTQPLTWLYT